MKKIKFSAGQRSLSPLSLTRQVVRPLAGAALRSVAGGIADDDLGTISMAGINNSCTSRVTK